MRRKDDFMARMYRKIIKRNISSEDELKFTIEIHFEDCNYYEIEISAEDTKEYEQADRRNTM